MPALLVSFVLLAQAAIPQGPARLEGALHPATFEGFPYKPAGYRDGPMLMVFHGMDRNADEYRDHARAMGDRFGMLVVAPRFDSKQFGAGKYQQGGLLAGGRLLPRDRWMWSFVPRLADHLRRLEGRPHMPFYLIGH